MPDEKAVAWFCAYTPLEILDAAGLHPARRFGNPRTLESADSTLHPALCPYVRACLAGEAEEAGPHHAVFVNSCDGMRRLHDAWKARFPGSFTHLVDLPRDCGPLGERLLALEMRRLAARLEEAWGARVTAGGLREAARAREERRREYLRRAEGCCGSERLRLAMAFQSRAGAAEGPPPDAGGRVEGGGNGVPVLLTGNLLNPEGLVSILDAAGARAAWIDLCNGDRAFSTPVWAEDAESSGDGLEAVFASLARGYLGRHPCARMSDGGRRYELLLERTREAGARGVVYASLKFCDAYLYDFPRLRERLDEAGMPSLRLESDYADGHAGQVLTRVEAFLEMI